MASKVWGNDLTKDLGLTWVTSHLKKIMINSTTPTSKTDATDVTKTMLGISTHLDVGGALTNTSHTGGGRKIDIAKTTDITIVNAGVADAISIIDASTLVYVTRCTTRALTTSDTVEVPAWHINALDPTTG